MARRTPARLERAAPVLIEAALVVLLLLPTVLGRLSTYIVLILALFVVLRPGISARFAARTPNPADGLFGLSFILVSLALLASANEPRDLAYILNFSPFLLMAPLRWELESRPRPDAGLWVARLALGGTVLSLGTALVQTLIFKATRVGQPIMNPFQFADTALLLGFLALIGLLVPGQHRRWPFLIGPLAGIAAVMLSGTRGALLALPLLSVIAFGFALWRSRHRQAIALAGLALMGIAALFIILAPSLGLNRATEAFQTLASAVQGGTVDESTEQRLTLYWGGLAAFLANPIVGYGWGDMVPAIMPYVPAEMLPIVRTFRQLHNGLVSYAVGAGSLGILSFILVSIAPLVGVWRNRAKSAAQPWLYAALVLVGSYQIFQLTYILLGYEFHTLQYAVVTAIILGYMPPAGSADASGRKRGT